MNPRERNYIGGSDAGTILGVSPWTSPWQLWARIVRPDWLAPEPVPGIDDDVDPKERGTAFEAGVAALYAQRTGAVLVEAPEVAHPRWPFLRAHIDRLDARDGSIVEIKTADHRQAHRWGGSGSGPQEEVRLPEEYLAQVHHYLALHPCAPHATVVVLLGMSSLRWYRVERDEEALSDLMRAEVDWWHRHVVGGEEPNILEGPAPLDNVRARHPAHVAPLLRGDETHLDAVRFYVEAREALKQAEAWKDAMQARLCALLGDAAGLELPGYAVTWKNNKPSEKTDWRAVASALKPPADLIARNTVVAPGARVLRVAEKVSK
jgi:putative phage-type endonuclease